jgi:hypothetical protein
MDVLYPGRSVTERLVTGCFVTGRCVTGRCVTGRFVGVPRILMICLYLLCVISMHAQMLLAYSETTSYK